MSSLSRKQASTDEQPERELAALFPASFVFGTSTSAYQIEGAVDEDGRGDSIWDTFSRTPGKTNRGQSGAVACDHYHRFREDIRLMAELGLSAYRFSIAWPRIIPDGTGAVNQKGLDFYDSLVDHLLANGIEPFPTLYHWDLPQTLEDRGGWRSRATADAFEPYAEAVVRRLGDRVSNWITLNEPWVQAWHGYAEGVHAPGSAGGPAGAIPVSHHLLLAHGKAVAVIRSLAPSSRVGITLDLAPSYPASDSPADEQAAREADGRRNRWFLDPVLRGHYPGDMVDLLALLPDGAESDMAAVAAPTDFLGINYYSRMVISARSDGPQSRDDGVPRTDAGWEIFPKGLNQLLLRVTQEYGVESIYVTENGAAYADGPNGTRDVADIRRQEYLVGHFQAAAAAIASGAKLDGYFVWSFLDNFEWAQAYDDKFRFGIVYVDFDDQTRTVKDSAKWYSALIDSHKRFWAE
ncbi:MAG TPA: GH1 family beta-glucosidase [Chloroflexota bacterium]|jgi:beta-glucosidase|nr:GH1 family beta-glucosidase [Chloroflexota bacterium]